MSLGIPENEMKMHSKRHAWIIAECRAWLKLHRPSLYQDIARIAKTYFPIATRGRTDRANLITMTVLRVMRVRYPEIYQAILTRAHEIYGFPQRPKRLGEIAWEIALTIGENWKIRQEPPENE
jgi:hypothetical protein